MSKGRKQSQNTEDGFELFSDADFDADEFVDKMDGKLDQPAEFRSGWRRLEALREEQMLRRELSYFDDWED